MMFGMRSGNGFDASTSDKQIAFKQASRILLDKDFKLIDLDNLKPWGFYLSVDESQAAQFIKEFYSGAELVGIDKNLPLRPKFLGIEPGKRLSWQYHKRRTEIWRCIAGEFDLVTSSNDAEDKKQRVIVGQIVNIPKGVRHRGVGLNKWALVAEIWQHTDPDHLSSEEDIIRVQDDFNR